MYTWALRLDSDAVTGDPLCSRGSRSPWHCDGHGPVNLNLTFGLWRVSRCRGFKFPPCLRLGVVTRPGSLRRRLPVCVLLCFIGSRV